MFPSLCKFFLNLSVHMQRGRCCILEMHQTTQKCQGPGTPGKTKRNKTVNNTSLYKHSSLLADLAPFITPWEQGSSHICLSVLSDSMLSAQHPLVRSSLRYWYAKHSADMEQQCLSASLPSISYFIPRLCEFLRIFLTPSVYSSHHKCDRKAWPRLFDAIT